MSTEWPGIDTIKGLVGEPPTEIKVPYKLLEKQQLLLFEWNPLFIAIIPYCFKCKEPLVWHHNPTDGVMFHCPKCNRRWIKGEGWEKTDEK
uniref:Uncharacterized protein n=1 Tax=viral metagenome TaxID=1070528 RepID=A0A6H1ZQT9_9ZZZZ